ncbi:hypothetical protein PEX1_016370 [Penicillium expansum]|uniref:Extracellular membrane protein CFEM domain-containing protein n=1 Tax=Penicillium expansum TaxID=27334 RepID=A0A0A2J4R2_PENEN|nr:hypothetical protein PEX2_027050 [Penicillium expansum]KGO42629.1 hypothetical protein PEXP_025000 [Penicillium expansum]KGO50382.1 hypothetical protein PEX2_027050 [Penicillium expansum]KGO65064.1 hypothetical protein PEX1_016370 [Penicillium expansum]
MRSFITASVLVAGALARSTEDYIKCATPKSAALGHIDTSKFTTCTSKTSQECFCANKSAIEALTTSTNPACAGLDLSTLASTLCSSDSDHEAAPARHASRPMQLVNDKRAYAPEAAVPRVVYVTETRTDCSCKSTPVAQSPMHVSQIPVDVPAASSVASVAAVSSTPAGRQHGFMGGAASSSVIFGPGATPSARPSGVDPTRFSPFQGAAAAGASVHGGVAALGVAAVMAVMVAL